MVTPVPIEIKCPVLLLDLPEPSLRAYPKATVIAEKFEAVISLGLANSRLKDYFDVWALLDQGEVLDCEVSLVLANTCKRRGTLIPNGPQRDRRRNSTQMHARLLNGRHSVIAMNYHPLTWLKLSVFWVYGPGRCLRERD